MERSSRSVSRRRLVSTAAGAAVLGSVLAAGPAAADWPAPPQEFSIASVGVSGQCLTAAPGLVGLKPCADPVGADQTWMATDGTYASKMRNAGTGECVLGAVVDNVVKYLAVDCGDSRLDTQSWRFVLVAGHTDRGVIHRRSDGRGALNCWQAFTGGSDGFSGGIRRDTACDTIKGDALPRVNMWTLTPVR